MAHTDTDTDTDTNYPTCSLLVLTSAATLLADGIGFSIGDTTATPFGEDGEVVGVTELCDDMYRPGGDGTELGMTATPEFSGMAVEDGGLVDDAPWLDATAEPEPGHYEAPDGRVKYRWAKDDSEGRPAVAPRRAREATWVQVVREDYVAPETPMTDGRWAHERDEFIAGQLADQLQAIPQSHDLDVDYARYGVELERRDSEYWRCLGIARRLAAVATRFPRRRPWARRQAVRLITHLDGRDDQSHRDIAALNNLAAQRGEAKPNNNWRCYLTKAQHTHLVACLTWVVNPTRKVTPMAKPASVPAPTATRDHIPGFWGTYLAWCLATAGGEGYLSADLAGNPAAPTPAAPPPAAPAPAAPPPAAPAGRGPRPDHPSALEEALATGSCQAYDWGRCTAAQPGCPAGALCPLLK